MSEEYFNLKVKLEELGYNNALPIDAVPLVKCLLADLLQTTSSLQHYMDLSKEAFKQRDSLVMQAEPHRCANIKLAQENNQLHRELIDLKEEYDRLAKESKRKIKMLNEELIKKESIITKLQHDVRDLSLRGLCAETLSSRNKSRRKDAGDTLPKVCICNEPKTTNTDREIIELTKKVSALEQLNENHCDEIALLKRQVEHRDSEIVRLNIMLEGGRPYTAIAKDCCKVNHDPKVQELQKLIADLENTNELLKNQIDNCLEKQHEAMLRALTLADKNKSLQEELKTVDALALKLEEDCNVRLAKMMNDNEALRKTLRDLTLKNTEQEKELCKYKMSSPKIQKYQDSLNVVLKEKEALQKEIQDLVELNKSLQEKILITSLNSAASKNKSPRTTESIKDKSPKCPTKDELQRILEEERKKYETNIVNIQRKLTDTMSNFTNHLSRCRDKDVNPKEQNKQSHENAFVKHLHNKLCESEQKILMLQKENDDLKTKIDNLSQGSKRNYKDIISQLNVENSELSKENIALSQQLTHFKNTAQRTEVNEFSRAEINKLKKENNALIHELEILRKDKQEYKVRYKESLEVTEKLKRDLAFKLKEIERLEEENCSYKTTHRTGKASEDHLKDECNFLREQIKRMQSDVIKEKTLANQIKNIQMETERSSNEIQNELLCTQKKLNLSKDTIDNLERKCKDLQSEIMSLKNDRSNVMDNLKKIDQERDKLVIELDHKTETICVLEQKINSQSFEITKLENEISEMKKKLNINKISEHKISDNEAQISYLNGEILRLQQKFDTALMENKHLQSSLADANGTLKVTKIEYDKSRKEVDGLKQQLQHYVAEIRRIEELLSEKEAERSDMLEQFASLSVEANILENTNHSLESESASKSLQLQTYISNIQSLEAKLLDKDKIIDNQAARLATLTCKVTSLNNEIKLITEEKTILEQNVSYLKQMCNNLQCEHENAAKEGICETDSELKLYENKIKTLTMHKAKLEVQRDELREKLKKSESSLANAKREIDDLKLALQDATSETRSLQERLSYMSHRRQESDITDNIETTITRELDLPLLLDETIHEEDEDSSRYSHQEVHKKYSKYSHGSTL